MFKLLPALVALMLAGCDTGIDEEMEVEEIEVVEDQAALGEQDPNQARQAAMMACPMAVEGTDVVVEDTDDGVALVFSTTSDVDQLRERVGHMAQMYEHHQAGDRMMWQHMQEMHEGGEHMGRDGMRGEHMGRDGMRGEHMGKGEMMPAATVETEETAQGMRLVLRPKDEAQLDELRTRVRAHQQHMSQGRCLMQPEQPAEPPATEGT